MVGKILYIFAGLYVVPILGSLWIGLSLSGILAPVAAVVEFIGILQGWLPDSYSTLAQSIDTFMLSLPLGLLLFTCGLYCGKGLFWFFRKGKGLFSL